MIYTNGFFQLLIKDDGSYLRIFPPLNNGESIEIQEIVSYLDEQKAPIYDIKAVDNIVKQATSIVEYKLSDISMASCDEKMKIKVMNAGMQVVCRFYPPSTNGKLITKEQIINKLNNEGVVFGIDEDTLDAYIHKRKYCTDIVLAEGEPPILGDNASVEINVEIKKQATPKLNEDGSVDFHNLGMVTNVKCGDILATLKKEVDGVPGRNVYGVEISVRKTKVTRLKPGQNTHISEDGINLISDKDGHASVSNGMISVLDILEFQNIDASTGDINYEGNVYIHGNVRTGFSVKAKGDITVDGAVEGAMLYSDGQICLKRGIMGMNKGLLVAKGNVIAKFIESSTVNAGGNVNADAILHSVVDAEGAIIVDGKNGSINGGKISTRSNILAKNLGSLMGTATDIYMGPTQELIDKMKDLVENLNKEKEEEEELGLILVDMKNKLKGVKKIPQEKLVDLQKKSNDFKTHQQMVKELSYQVEVGKNKIASYSRCKLKVKEMAYPGVKIKIVNNVMHVRSQLSHCQFVSENADIVMLPL